MTRFFGHLGLLAMGLAGTCQGVRHQGGFTTTPNGTKPVANHMQLETSVSSLGESWQGSLSGLAVAFSKENATQVQSGDNWLTKNFKEGQVVELKNNNYTVKQVKEGPGIARDLATSRLLVKRNDKDDAPTLLLKLYRVAKGNSVLEGVVKDMLSKNWEEIP
eukprot:TRINITY_DN41330_c0_g2_i2.p1 TRINITY_DN41330_c0_g2~~TRINITY_DN41330_c0_g2_i2.p1  ORF type:complete len:187 (-),score=21.13 TRINITY_DN41330_c0_g2_i2:22-507(-)